MTHKDFSEKKMENVISQASEWFAAFKESTQFKELSFSAQTNSGIVTMALSEWMYKEELRAGREWTAATLENILVNVFPREVSEYSEVSSDILSILTYYFTFLKDDKKITNADTLLRRLVKLFSSEARTEEVTETNEKVKKSQAKVKESKNPVHSEKYSARDIAQFNSLEMGNAINAMPQSVKEVERVEAVVKKVGRNESCPCGSGKKFKKCHGK